MCQTYFHRVWIVVLTWLALTGTLFASQRAAVPWYRIDEQKNVRIMLYLFYSSRCPHCQDALRFTDELTKKYAWLEVKRFETSANPANLEYYRTTAASINRVAGQVPAFFYCNQLDIGYNSYERNGRRIETTLIRWHEDLSKQLKKTSLSPPQSPSPFAIVFGIYQPDEPAADGAIDGLILPEPEESVSLPWWGDVSPEAVSLPLLTIVLAGCDAFNPCAFFVLLFLLSLMVHARSRWRMLAVGGIFVFASGLIYFLFMAAWLNLFLVAGHLAEITLAAGVLAVGVALINIKDYFWFKTGPSLSIPDTAKPGLFQRMTRLVSEQRIGMMIAGTVVLASLTNLYELMCTAGFPMVYTRILTLRNLPPTTYYLYLVLYNIIYVIPLAAIVVGFTFTLGSRKLTEAEGRVLKLLSGLMMLSLGILLVLRPEWLSTLWAGLAILALSIAATAITHFFFRPQDNTGPHQQAKIAAPPIA